MNRCFTSKSWMSGVLFSFVAAAALGSWSASNRALATPPREPEPPEPLLSLKAIPVPEPVNLNEFVKNRVAAVALGKAFFWDMQVGSSGVQACASCHFHAGADNRRKNNVSPGLPSGDTTFELPGPNGRVKPANFPLTSFKFPDQRGFERDSGNPFVHNINDAMSSQGVRHFEFKDIVLGRFYEKAKPIYDPTFNVHGKSTRRVEPRNTPTVINAVFNFSNFLDGRARNIFNGVNPFGELDEEAKVFADDGSGIYPTQVRIPDASLASQAVGPPLSDFEMSSLGRTFPKVGKKMLSLRPLARQHVHSRDSVLGYLAHHHKGLKTSYAKLIKAAFHRKWWRNQDSIIKFEPTVRDFHAADLEDPRSFFFGMGAPKVLPQPRQRPLKTDEFTQMEANFSLFFGLAVQLYEATLVSDDAKFDRVVEKRATFTPDEQEGFDTFMNQGKCVNCHRLPEFTNHSVRNVREGQLPTAPGFIPKNFIEFMNIANRSNVIYDNGIYNIGVRPAGSTVSGDPGFVPNTEDVGRGGTAPMINPLTGTPYPLSIVRLSKLKAQNLLPSGVAQFIPDLPPGVPADNEVAVDGAIKAPSLRNADLTGPYFHNGDAATLQQVVEFYTRGGSFPVTNAFNLDPDIEPIGHLAGHPERQRQLVAFLRTLTDDRVKYEMAPFDHPEIHVPNGSPGNEHHLRCNEGEQQDYLEASGDWHYHKSYCDDFLKIPAVGAGGRSFEGLPPLEAFLGLNPEDS